MVIFQAHNPPPDFCRPVFHPIAIMQFSLLRVAAHHLASCAACFVLGATSHAAAPPAPASSAISPPAAADPWPARDAMPCHGIRDLAVVAHMDDDLLFMNPDLQSVVQAGGCLAVLYLTASERDEGVPYMLERERAVRAAHAHMAGLPDQWQEDRINVAGHTLARYRLQGRPGLQLLHMRLQDPWLGHGWGSLTPLSQAESIEGQSVDTLGDFQERYDRAALVYTLAALIHAYQPTTIRHLDDTSAIPYTSLCWRCAGHGHPDHIASARLTRDAIKQLPGHYTAIGYVDYPTQDRAANLSATATAAKTDTFLRYAWLDRRYCAQGQTCHQPYGPTAAWVARSYYQTRHDMPAALAADSRGSLILATTSEWSNAATTWSASPGGWQALDSHSAEAPQSFAWPDGAAGLLLRDAMGIVHSTRQDPASGTWQAWQALDGMRIMRPPVLSPQGSHAIALGNDGQLYWSRAIPAAPAARHTDAAWRWQNWQALPPLSGASADLALLQADSGELQAFALARNGVLYTSQQAFPALTWTPWQKLAAPLSSGGLAVLAHEGEQELYLRGQDGQLYHISRASPEASWQAPEALALRYVGQPAIGLDDDGDVVIAALEQPGGAVWVLEEDAAPLRLIPHAGSLPTLGIVAGTLHLAARQAGTVQAYELWRRDPRSDTWIRETTAALPAAAQTSPDAPGAIPSIATTPAVSLRSASP